MRKIMTLCLFLFLALSLSAVSVMAQGEHSGRQGADFRPSMHNKVRPGKQRHSNRWATMRAEEAKILSYLKKNQPQAFKKLMRLKRKDPRKYREILQKKAQQMHSRKGLKEKSPEQNAARMREMERKSQQLAAEYKRAKGPKKKKALKADLRTQLNKLFDLKQENRETEIKRVQKELDKLQENITKRSGSKEKMVNRRLQELTGKSGYLQW